MRLLRHAGLGLLAIVLAGCLFQPGPDAAAKDWMQALAAQDGLKLGELTCDAAQTQLQNTALIYSALGVLSGSFLGGAQPKIGVDELKYQTLNADGTTAEVKVTGRMRAAIMALSNAQDVDFTMRMRNEKGKWKYCGEGPTASAASPTPRVSQTPRVVATATASRASSSTAWQTIAEGPPCDSHGASCPPNREGISAPQGIAVDRDGFIYVTDGGNYRITKLSPQGNIVAKWGSQGNGPGQFSGPDQLALDANGNIYVHDIGTSNRIQKLSPQGTPIAQWSSTDPNPSCPVGDFLGFAVDADGNIYTSQIQQTRIQKRSSDGRCVGYFGGPGTGPGEFKGTSRLALDRQGNIYVVDGVNGRIQKFAPNGAPLAQWGSQGNNPGQLNQPWGIAVDQEGNIYVTETNALRVHKFAANGRFMARWDAPKRVADEGATEIAVDPNGNVYISNGWGNRILKLPAALNR